MHLHIILLFLAFTFWPTEYQFTAAAPKVPDALQVQTVREELTQAYQQLNRDLMFNAYQNYLGDFVVEIHFGGLKNNSTLRELIKGFGFNIEGSEYLFEGRATFLVIGNLVNKLALVAPAGSLAHTPDGRTTISLLYDSSFSQDLRIADDRRTRVHLALGLQPGGSTRNGRISEVNTDAQAALNLLKVTPSYNDFQDPMQITANAVEKLKGIFKANPGDAKSMILTRLRGVEGFYLVKMASDFARQSPQFFDTRAAKHLVVDGHTRYLVTSPLLRRLPPLGGYLPTSAFDMFRLAAINKTGQLLFFERSPVYVVNSSTPTNDQPLTKIGEELIGELKKLNVSKPEELAFRINGYNSFDISTKIFYLGDGKFLVVRVASPTNDEFNILVYKDDEQFKIKNIFAEYGFSLETSPELTAFYVGRATLPPIVIDVVKKRYRVLEALPITEGYVNSRFTLSGPLRGGSNPKLSEMLPISNQSCDIALRLH